MMRFPIAGFRAIALITTILLAVSATAATADEAQHTASTPAYYRLKLGDLEIVALSDGTRTLNAHQLVNIEPAALDRALAGADQSNPVPTSFNAFLVDTGRRRILIDSGAGSLWGPKLGQLTASLRAAGYGPEQIDEIYFTHLHTDHVGGLMDGDQLRFPNAVVRASQQEADYWLSPAHLNRAADDDKGSFRNAMTSIYPYAAAQHFQTFDGDIELAPGIRAIASGGHTAGHTSYLIESRGQRLLVWGDMLHVAAVQFAAPQATMRFDFDRDLAVATRRQAYAAAARDGYLIAGAHLPFPGLGRVSASAGGYRWIPVNSPRAGAGAEAK